jgi:hypothetical protein
VWTAIMAPSVGASSRTTSGTSSDATSPPPHRILHHIFRDCFGGLGLAVRSRPWSRPDSRIYGSSVYDRSSRARRGGHVGGRGPGQKYNQRMKPHWKKEGGEERKLDKPRFPNPL